MGKIWADTRQRAGKHANIDGWFDAHGVEYEYKALPFGDYATDASNVVVDSKRSIAEVARNLTREHDRFARECDRAAEAGYRLVILIEVGGRYSSIRDVFSWVGEGCRRCDVRRAHRCDPRRDACVRYRRKPVQGRQVALSMQAFERRHGCVFEFCPPSRSARRICELLGVEVESDGEVSDGGECR